MERLVDVIWYTPEHKNSPLHRPYSGLAEYLLSNSLWPVPSYDFRHYASDGGLPDDISSHAVIVVSANDTKENMNGLNKLMAAFSGVVLVLLDDENSAFVVTELRHGNLIIWSQTLAKTYQIGAGFPGAAFVSLPVAKREADSRNLDWFFAGNPFANNVRHAAVENLRSVANGSLYETSGTGLPYSEYYRLLSNAKIAPCPFPASHRYYEALEAGCVPLVDTDPGFRGWEKANEMIDELVVNYPQNSLQPYSQWQQTKREMSYQLNADLKRVGAPITYSEGAVTAVILASAAHTDSVLKTSQIRQRLPDADIIIVFDAIHPNQRRLAADYYEELRKLLWECNFEGDRVLPVISREPLSQAALIELGKRFSKTEEVRVF